MSDFSFTPAQRTAVFYPDGNLLLSAAAGSGKTAALTGRIVEVLRSGRARLSEMLIVTFTRAAAAEMRSRLHASLQKLAGECRASGDSETAERLTLALAELPSARLSTIHAFLYQSLRPYFPLAGLPVDARILEEQAAQSLNREVMRAVVNDFFRDASDEEPSPGEASFTELADILSEVRDTDALDGELLWLAGKLTSAGLDEGALLRFAEKLAALGASGSELLRTDFGSLLREETAAFAAHYRRIFAALGEEMEAEPAVKKAYGPTNAGLSAWLEGLETLAESLEATYDALRSHLDALKDYLPQRLGALRRDSVTETSQLFRDFRDEMKVELGRMRDSLFAGASEEAYTAARATARILRCLARVLGEYFRRLARFKAERGVLDYGDLETLALHLLIGEDGAPTKAAEEIGAGCRYVFVDEYQDTNGVQDRIFRAVCGHSVRFLVGDVKQSIYRFRGADPSVFSDYRRTWETAEPVPEGEERPEIGEWNPAAGKSLFLSENFRCAAPVVALVNAVSAYILPHGGTPFEEGDRLIHARGEAFDAPPAELCLIEKVRKKSRNDSEDEAGDELPESENPAEGENPEAEYVAERIASMIGRYTPEGKLLRACDIAILLRSPGSSGDSYRRALARRGIESKMKTEQPLGSSPAVLLLLCLLHFVDNPLRDEYAAGALRSPVLGFTLDDLIRLREAAGESGTFREALSAAADSENPSDSENPEASVLRGKCRRTLGWLERHRTAAGGMSAGKYVEFLIRDADLFSVAGIRGRGGERLAVQRFLRLSQTGERAAGDFYTLSSFLADAEDALSRPADRPADGEDEAIPENCVPILSLHAAKGLEFPVCFVSECAKNRNQADETRTVLFDPALGLGMCLPDEGGLTRCDTFPRRAIAEKLRRDSVDEEMRMLYVALTRARDHLILTAKTYDAEKTLRGAAVQAEFADGWHIRHTRTYLDWVLEALCRTPLPGEATVTTVPAAVPAEEADIPEIPEESEPANPANPAEPIDWAARFSFRYPNAYRNRLPAKLSVSRLSPRILDEEEDVLAEEAEKNASDAPSCTESAESLELPAFMQASEPSPTERGTAAHAFLQFTDFTLLRERGVSSERERLLAEGYLTPAQGELLPMDELETFRQSRLMEALLRSAFVRREFRFNVRMPAERFTTDPELRAQLRQNGDGLTVQGVVDCLFRDPDTGGLVLVDYKTDALAADSAESAKELLRRRHRRQLTYYREICARLFGERIQSAVIYATALGGTVEID